MKTGYLWRLIAVAALFVQAVPSFSVAMNFLMAETPEQAALRGRSMPPHWSAGVWGHGRYLQWDTISDQPWRFGAACFGLGAAAATLFLGALFSGQARGADAAATARLEGMVRSLSGGHAESK